MVYIGIETIFYRLWNYNLSLICGREGSHRQYTMWKRYNANMNGAKHWRK